MYDSSGSMFAGLKPDLSHLPPDAAGCINSPAQLIAFNQSPPFPPSLTITGGNASTATPTDSNRKVVGLLPVSVATIVFGN